MAGPRLKRRRVLAAKIETEVGTAEELAVGDGAFNIFDTMPQVDTEFFEREGQGGFSPLPGTLGAYGATLEFETELHGSGNDGAPTPAWALAFLPACGFVVSSGTTYVPQSMAPGAAGSSTKTLTIGVYEDGVFKVLKGCMGNAVFTFVSGQVVRVRWTFTGVWVAPTDVALIAPDYPSVAPLRFASATMTLGGWTPKLQELTIDLGNEVVLREDAAQASGYISAVITSRRINGTMNPEAELVADNDTYGDWLALTEDLMTINLGSAGGNTINILAPKFQVTNPQEGDRDNIQTDDLEWQANRDTDAGDDEMTIEFT